MSSYRAEPPYQHGTQAQTGILLVNLGTPDAPTARSLRSYLKQFLSDARVIEIPRVIWGPVLHGIILNMRPRKSAQRYAKIWMSEGSPLRVHTERQTKLLRGYLGERIKSPLSIEYAMRYGSPSIASSLAALKHCERILLLPLYPQYAASTTASSFDAVFQELLRTRNAPALRTVKHYHDHPAYIAALAQNVNDYWMKNGRPDKLVISFHGVPRYTLDKGDPYHCECQKTARLLAEALGWEEPRYQVCFQSRFGRAEWLKPYTMEVLHKLGKQHTERVDVVCPGFVSDCLETLEEIAIEGKAAFLNSGGTEFHYIPCLNERADWIHALCQIALENLQGWVSVRYDAQAAQVAGRLSRERAVALGAKA
ncbi:MAG TPA: ferrochelatase [Burkholderiales bacterium]|nr:ferrochelatase [Burkholderiales bacterium]